MLGSRPDVLIVRTARCGEDPRVNKIAWHYSKLGYKVGIQCFSRTFKCSGPYVGGVTHRSSLNIRYRYINSMPRVVRRLLILCEYLKAILMIRLLWNPKIVHGCDLDGYLVGQYGTLFRRSRKYKIFEIYDPWQTMTLSPKLAKLENRSIDECDLLIMPSEDGRIKPLKRPMISISNAMDIDLLQTQMSKTRIKSEQDFGWLFNLDYIIVGGTVSKDVGINLLINLATQSNVKVVVVCSKDKLSSIEDLSNRNLITINSLPWGAWLNLVSHALACWVYYDDKNYHYRSHISPNKYWESAILDIPMFVNNLRQFCDRTNLEPLMIEVGLEMEESFREGILRAKQYRESMGIPKSSSQWQAISQRRTETLASGLDAMMRT